MIDKDKTHAQLIAELTQLRERVTELETAQPARPRAEEMLRDSQTRLPHTEAVAHFGRWELNLAERKVRGSAGASAIYGLPGEEWPLAEVQGLPLPEYRAMLDAALANLIEHQQPYDVEFRIWRPSDGQLRDIQSIAEYDVARRVVCGAIHDITAHKRAESQREAALEALRESEERLTHIIDFLPDATLVIDRARRIIAWNQAVEEMTGTSKNEILGQTGFAQAVPFYGKTRPILIDLIFNGQNEIEKEYDFVSRKGKQLTAEVFAPLLYKGKGAYLWAMAAPLYDSSGRVVGAIESIRDITAHKQAEEALRESEEKYRRIVETANEGIISLDSQARITFINRQTTAMLGYTAEEMLGHKYESFMMDDQLSDHAAQMKNRALGQDAVYERCFRRKDGSPHWALVSASAILDADGKFAGSFGMLADITKRKRAESQREAAHAALRESNAELQIRNEELDVFAHMVAHDLKNPLGAMMGYAELLTETYDTLPTELIRETLNSINRIGRKTANIIESLFVLVSVRKQDVRAAPLDMGHLVAEVLLRLTGSIQDSGADLHVPDRAGWPVALGYAPWIEEIWVNYLSNAIKYGGPRPRIDLGAARQPDGFIRFSVRDYGAGLTPEQQERLFAPFERLEQVQVEGHGLGLSIVRRIAEKLGGRVGVDSQPGTLRGSTFYFTLPAAPDL
jgi:PAS domain S-box-containing protein